MQKGNNFFPLKYSILCLCIRVRVFVFSPNLEYLARSKLLTLISDLGSRLETP